MVTFLLYGLFSTNNLLDSLTCITTKNQYIRIIYFVNVFFMI
jgi:hypothetical protein